MLDVQDLTKTYRRVIRANDGVSLAIERGEVFGLLGHNGAGKTTLINQIVGLLRPDRGTITLDGRDVVADPDYARRACSLQPQAQVPISGLTPRQVIDVIGRLRGSDRRAVRLRSAQLVESLDIGEWIDTDGARLSGGVRRLVSFAMAAIAPGSLVMLDEPTNDVDPVRRRLLWRQVRALADEGVAVLLVTHNVIEAERSVDRLAILDRGRVIAEGTPASLRSSVASALRLELVVEPDVEIGEAPSFVRRLTPIAGGRVIASVTRDGAADAVQWAESLRAAGRIEEFGLTPATLEDVYVQLVGSGRAGAEGAEGGPIDARAA